jgi:hypothetical protein
MDNNNEIICSQYKIDIIDLKKKNLECQKKNSKYIYSIFHTIMSIVAIYLSIRCNEKINYASIFFAFIFPYPYIIYNIIYYKGLCVEKK